MQAVMSHTFGRIPEANIQRSVFDLSHGHKTTFSAGFLVPVLAMEVVPGDSFSVNSTMVTRIASPLKYPIMDNLKMDVHYFFVPHRLVWDNFQKFMGERESPSDSTSYVVPTVPTPVGGVVAETLFDYLGVMIGVAGKNINALYSRSYNRIYNDWYKDQNIISSAVVDKDDGPDVDTDYVLRRRAKYHDYFTSCLPWPQKGTAVELPLGTSAPVFGIGSSVQAVNSPVNVFETGRGDAQVSYAFRNAGSMPNELLMQFTDATHPAVYADLSSATASTINSLREAFQLQKFYEALARGGQRYIEIIKSCFGVTSPDARLQRTEFLGGSSAPFSVTSVPNTSATATEKQGNLAGYGQMVLSDYGFTKSFTEHGIIMGIVSVRADQTYQQGLHRKFSRSTREDFYWPQFAHLGEQAVLTQEIFCDASANDSVVFGYQERYAEMRYEPSRISGKFRSTYSAPLDPWHLSEEFANAPTLSQAFIECDPPMSRVKAVTSEPDFLFDSYFKIRAARPMPTFGIPGFIDHF